MRCLCLGSYHFLPTLDIFCCVLCCVYAYAKMCVGGGGANAYACVKSIEFMSVCELPLATPPLLWCPLDMTHA